MVKDAALQFKNTLATIVKSGSFKKVIGRIIGATVLAPKIRDYLLDMLKKQLGLSDPLIKALRAVAPSAVIVWIISALKDTKIKYGVGAGLLAVHLVEQIRVNFPDNQIAAYLKENILGGEEGLLDAVKKSTTSTTTSDQSGFSTMGNITDDELLKIISQMPGEGTPINEPTSTAGFDGAGVDDAKNPFKKF